jgi:hypothetical protein
VGEGIEMLDHATMVRALVEGTASHLSQTITKFIRYRQAWWGRAPFGWVKLTDQQACAGLDAFAAKLAAADVAVQASSAERAHSVQPAAEAR